MALRKPYSRRLRLGMVGGGRNGNIGASHRAAALLDGRWDVVAGSLSRDVERAHLSAEDWHIDPERSYTSFSAMAATEALREDRIDAVTICTPNNSHYDVALEFIRKGFNVICDKPLTTSLDRAAALVTAARQARVVFAVTHTYSGYPMVRMARDLIASGELGDIRSVGVEYVSQYQSDAEAPSDWQNDPAQSGPLGIVAGTGTHAHHLVEFVTGLRLVELSADLASLVPGHQLEDHATMHLRFNNGARGYLWNSTIAPGNENGLSLRVYGSKGGLRWSQEHPNQLFHSPLNGQTTILTRGGFSQTRSAMDWTRVPSGHPEGYLEAFANLYSEIADAILDHEQGVAGNQYLFPTVDDGARGLAFMFAALESSRGGARFVKLAA